MDFREPDEHAMLRDAVRGSRGGLRPRVLRRPGPRRWAPGRAVGRAGGQRLPRRRRPRGVRRRRRGHQRARDRLRGAARPAAARCCSWRSRPRSAPRSSPASATTPSANGGSPASPLASCSWRSAITEPDAGSNSHRIATTATRDGDTWVLRGTKYYITGVDQAEAVLVVARTGTDRGDGPGRAVAASWCPRTRPDSPGPRSRSRSRCPRSSSRCSSTTSRWPPTGCSANRATGSGRCSAASTRNASLIAAIANGIGRYALDRAAAYAKERVVWDVPIGAHQGVAHPLAQAKVELELARLDGAEGGVDVRPRARRRRAREHGQVRVGRGRRSRASTRRSRPTAVTAWRPSTASPTCGRSPGCCASPPVSREMILNFVAQHSLDLPRSY